MSSTVQPQALVPHKESKLLVNMLELVLLLQFEPVIMGMSP